MDMSKGNKADLRELVTLIRHVETLEAVSGRLPRADDQCMDRIGALLRRHEVGSRRPAVARHRRHAVADKL